jgi:hypothetical protein
MVRANDSTHRRPPLHAAAASLPSRRGLGDDDRAADRRHADYEYGLHLNQLDLVTAFAGDRPDGRLATAPSPGDSPFHLDFLKAFASPMQITKRSNCLSSTGRLWILDNDSLEVTTSTRSPMRSSRTDGRFACGARARRLDAVLDLGHQRQALLNKSSHHGTAPATVSAAQRAR